MTSRTTLKLAAAITAAILAVTGPALGSDPASQDATVPTVAGEEVVLTWTGTVPPGAEQSGDCQAATSDVHDVTLAVPAGTYDTVRVSGVAAGTYSDPLTDMIISVVLPDGTIISQDSGFTDTDEAVSFANPADGVLQVRVCAFAGGGAAYDGTLTLSAEIATDANAVPAVSCLAPDAGFKYETEYIDTTRAGGEPIVVTHPDGTLLWGSHAGTTHFFGPAAPDPATAAFIENYEGQTYQYFSEDDGVTWEFAARTPINAQPTSGLPNSGFSDPEFAIDAAGNVYISEINLANIAISKSSDSGRTYTLQSLAEIITSDRQWMEADAEDVLYLTANGVGVGGPTPGGHFLIKSTDGGVTFSEYEYPNPNGVADVKIDPRSGDLFEITASPEGQLAMARYRGIRDVESGFVDTLELGVIAEGVGYSPIGRLIDPTFDMDADGNLYIVWTENGEGAAGRNAGVWYSYSTDFAATWADPIRVDPDASTEIWPWISVGGPGQVAINYLATEAELENNDAETATADDGWNVVTAYSDAGVGCDEAEAVAFDYSQASPEPVHFGTICQGGTICQTMAVDRRLGDYFANEVDSNGALYVAVSDTIQGGAVSLPRVIRQVEGPDLRPSACAIGDGDRVSRLDVAGAVTLGTALSEGCFATADTAILARDDVFADALASGGLAGQLDAPVLLTPTDGLDEGVAAELTRLGVQRVVLAGGTAALSPQIEADLDAMGVEHTRIGGAERFSTAALIADAVVEEGGQVDRAVVALGDRPDGGDAWPDALASGVLSATARVPVLLSQPDAAPEPTIAALDRLLEPGAEVLVVGGPAAVGDSVIAQLTEAGYAPRRVAGPDRYATAVAVAEEARTFGADLDTVVVASGEEFTAALIGGPAAARAGGVMLLAHPETLANGPATEDFLSEHATEIGDVFLLGTSAALSDTVFEEIVAALEPAEEEPDPEAAD